MIGEKSKWKSTCIIIIITLLIAPLIGFGAPENVTELPENGTLVENVPEFNESQPENITDIEQIITILSQPENSTYSIERIITILSEPEDIANITAPIITILSPENTTYNTTSLDLNYTIKEPADWVGYSLNGADIVTITGNITFDAPVGLNHLVVYAEDTAGNIGNAEVHFNVTVTDSLGIRPQLSAKKDFFSLNEEPAFTFEYNPFRKSVDVKTLPSVNESKEGFVVEEAGTAALGKPRKAVKKWTTENETIEAFVYDCSGKLTDIVPEIEQKREGKFEIKLPERRACRAGVYQLSVELVKDEHVYFVKKDFPWGLVSVNTKKSIYKPDETAEFIIVVLDKEGHAVCDADISMIVTNPNNESSFYCTCDATILPEEECGLYTARYLTEVEGNHTLNVITSIGGIELAFETDFLVQQNYEFDIVRTAQSKIDPTRQDWFEVTIDIESFTDTRSLTLKEFVPAEFEILTDAATVLSEDDTKTIIWHKAMIEGKTSVSYSYSVPPVWPYLYALGPVEIGYNENTFMEARAWYVAVDPLGGWANSSFDRCKNITISNAGSSNLTNFPAYINVTKDDDMLSNYQDLRFYSEGCNCGGSLLDHEIENYTASNAHIWVRIPSLSTTGKTISVYYKNNTLIEDGQNASGVWDSNFNAVYHMGESPTSSINDSTTNNVDLTSYGSMTESDLVGGIVGSGIDFDGNDRLLSSAQITFESFTFEAWVSADDWSNWRTMIAPDGDSRDFCTDGGTLTFWDGSEYTIGPTLSGTDWNYLAVRYDDGGASNRLRGFVNGTMTSQTANPTYSSLTDVVSIAAVFYSDSYTDYWDGRLDEIRISNVSRTTDWINQGYQMVANQESYVSFGSEESPNQPSEDLFFETGIVEANGWTTVNLKRIYNEAIVVARPREGYETSADHEIATAIITNITSTSFRVQLRNEGAAINGNVSYIAVENGTHMLSNGMLLQAGRYEPVNYYDANGESSSSWNSITFYTPYESSPVVIASPNNESADDWVSVRYDSGSLTTSGVSISLEIDNMYGNAPVAADPPNSIGWIAMNRTNATNMEAWLETAVDEDPAAGDWRSLVFSNNYTTPLFFAMQEEASGTDPCTVGMQNLAPGGVDIRLAEERTDGEQTHGTEDVLWMVFESDLENGPPTSPTDITCNGGSCNITIDTSVILNASGSTDPDDDTITYFLEATLENVLTSDDQESREIQYKAENASPSYGFKVYYEQFTWSSGTSTYRSIGATVNTSNAFLILYSAAGNVPTPDIWQITGYIYNSTYLLFERADTGTAYVSWFVVECFGGEFTVQRGSIDINSGSTSNTSTISSVNTSRSIVVGQGRVNSASAVVDDSQDGYATLELQNSTTVIATRASTATDVAATCRYEVVEFSESSNIEIQTGETTLSSTNPLDVNINSINQSSSWLYHTWDASDNGLQQTSVYGQITDDTVIQFGRYSSTSYTNRIRWYVIYHSNNDTSVTRDNYNWNPPSNGVNDRDNAISPVVNKSHTFLMHSSSVRGTGAAFARNKNLPYYYDNPTPGDNWRETQYHGTTANSDQHETRCQIVTLPYSAGSGADDTEATKEWTTYTDVIASAWRSITQINVTVNVSVYNNSGSTQNGNNFPDLALELATSDGGNWTEIGNFSISGTGNLTLVTSNSAIVNAWLTPVNRDARLRGINFDYNASSSIDQINYTDVWVTLDGKEWTEIGSHAESSELTWNTTDIAEQTCVDLRARSIDLSGSNSYSDYYTKGCCLNIKHNFATTLDIRNQAASQSITSIEVSGSSGNTITDPSNDVDGSSSPQNTSATTPVVTIYNPSPSNYLIWLKVEEGSEWWDYIIADEKFNVTADATDPGQVSTWTSLRPWRSYKDSGLNITNGNFKDLYLAFQLRGSGTGNATISVLGEVV